VIREAEAAQAPLAGEPNDRQTNKGMNMTKTHSEEVSKGERFQFGANWAAFLGTLNDERIKEAEDSLKKM